jgi:hypothetical protein
MAGDDEFFCNVCDKTINGDQRRHEKRHDPAPALCYYPHLPEPVAIDRASDDHFHCILCLSKTIHADSMARHAKETCRKAKDMMEEASNHNQDTHDHRSSEPDTGTGVSTPSILNHRLSNQPQDVITIDSDSDIEVTITEVDETELPPSPTPDTNYSGRIVNRKQTTHVSYPPRSSPMQIQVFNLWVWPTRSWGSSFASSARLGSLWTTLRAT